MSALKVHQTAPAPVMARWLSGILANVIKDAKLPFFPVEIRPTGRWGGWAQGQDCAPDGRLSLSSKIAFWESERIAWMYLHEATHRLFEGQAVPDHGAEFLCLNAILLIRASDHFSRNSLEQLSLYDLSDQPAELQNTEFWQGEVLNWALKTAYELAPTETPATELAAVVCERWQQHLDDQFKARQKAVFAAERRAAELQDLKNSKFLYLALAVVGWTGFLLVVSVLFFKN